jgi:hypothetical protein
METPYRPYQSQGLRHVYRNILPIQKQAFKLECYTRRVQNISYIINNLCLSCLGVCGGQSSVESTAPTALLAILIGAHRFAICIWCSKFCTYMTIQINYAGERHKSSKPPKYKCTCHWTGRIHIQKIKEAQTLRRSGVPPFKCMPFRSGYIS